MHWLLLLPFVAILGAQDARPEVRSSSQDRTHLGLTLYHEGIALVRDRRKVDFPIGHFRLALADLSPKIRPKTALLRSLDDQPLGLLEQNFEYNLLSPEGLVQGSLGQQVGLRAEVGSSPVLGRLISLPVPTDLYPPPRTALEARLDPKPAIWRAARIYRGRWARYPLVRNDAGVVVQTADGFIPVAPEALGFKALPGGLRSTPTLVEDIQAERPQPRLLELAYLTEGLSWNVHYVGVLDEAASSMDLQAMVTLTNESGSSFPDATLQLVAGDPNTVPDPDPVAFDPDSPSLDHTTVEVAASRAPGFEEETLADYHLYTLDRPTSLESGQTKQVQLFRVDQIHLDRHFRADILDSEFSGPLLRAEAKETLKYLRENESYGVWLPLDVQAGLSWTNDLAHGLGRPLPQGDLDLSIRDRSGSTVPLDPLPFPATPKGQPIELWPGAARGWNGRKRLADARLDRKGLLLTWEIEISLQRFAPENLTIRHLVQADWLLVEGEVPIERPASDQLRINLHLNPGEYRRFSYTIRAPWSPAAVSESPS